MKSIIVILLAMLLSSCIKEIKEENSAAKYHVGQEVCVLNVKMKITSIACYGNECIYYLMYKDKNGVIQQTSFFAHSLEDCPPN